MSTSSRMVAALAVGALLCAQGCGPVGPRTYPISGKVALTGGEVRHLAGCSIEAALQSDPTVRASGVIQDDGSFTLETLHEGAILKGAREGAYRVRIILSEEDRDSQRRAAQAVAPRFLRFETSGLSLKVPAGDSVTVTVSPR